MEKKDHQNRGTEKDSYRVSCKPWVGTATAILIITVCNLLYARDGPPPHLKNEVISGARMVTDVDKDPYKEKAIFFVDAGLVFEDTDPVEKKRMKGRVLRKSSAKRPIMPREIDKIDQLVGLAHVYTDADHVIKKQMLTYHNRHKLDDDNQRERITATDNDEFKLSTIKQLSKNPSLLKREIFRGSLKVKLRKLVKNPALQLILAKKLYKSPPEDTRIFYTDEVPLSAETTYGKATPKKQPKVHEGNIMKAQYHIFLPNRGLDITVTKKGPADFNRAKNNPRYYQHQYQEVWKKGNLETLKIIYKPFKEEEDNLRTSKEQQFEPGQLVIYQRGKPSKYQMSKDKQDKNPEPTLTLRGESNEFGVWGTKINAINVHSDLKGDRITGYLEYFYSVNIEPKKIEKETPEEIAEQMHDYGRSIYQER